MYEFKDNYKTGIDFVDQEHKRLFEIAEEAYQYSKMNLSPINMTISSQFWKI